MKPVTKKITFSAMLLALGMILPFLTMHIPRFGNMLLPMHIPVLLCGLICGPVYGGAVGFILPLLRSAVFGAPVLFPTAIAMSFELMTYGAVIGLLYFGTKGRGVPKVYGCLIGAMLSGRAVWGISQIMLLGLSENGFTAEMFIAGAFLNAVPGIALQLVLIPAVMAALDKSGITPVEDESRETAEC